MINSKMSILDREMILTTALSNRKVFETYQSACKGVQDWTQALDVGPFEQFKSETEPI